VSAGVDLDVVPTRHKYALLTLPVPIDGSLPGAVEVAPGLLATREGRFELPGHWAGWIGSLGADELREAPLCLWAIAPTQAAGILDAENELLKLRVWSFFQGLLLATPRLGAGGRPNLLTGGRGEGDPDIRQRVTPDQPLYNDGVVPHRVGEGEVRQAAEVAERLLALPGPPEYRRLRSILHGFYAGICGQDSADRIHAFVRCVEGCILPARGRTERQFAGRTELFLGPRHHGWAQAVYRIRSAVEHLNDRFDVTGAPTEREARLAILRHAHECQELARDCLFRILTRPGLLTHFRDDAVLGQFWGPTMQAQRVTLWGDPMDLGAVSGAFDPNLAKLDEA
jgi:hypothetical protein